MKGASGGVKKKTIVVLENDAVQGINGNFNGDINGDHHSETDCSSRSKEEEDRGKEKAQIENENEEDEEEEEDGDDDGEEDNEKEDEFDDERSKLDDGFYEIEAIRHKRVRKGQLQYLIKWRGWPETANTWEPLENLQSIVDVIESFEESLRSGKSSRNRRRKNVVLHTQSKKKPPCSIVVEYNVTDVEIGVVDKKNLPPSTLTNTSLTSHCAPTPTRLIDTENNVDINNGGSKQIDERKEENEYDPKLSELRETISTGEVNGLTNGVTKVDVINNRCIGAKKRKSGSVKRFKHELTTSHVPVEDNNILAPEFTVGSSGGVCQIGVGTCGLLWDNNTSQKNFSGGLRNAPPIVKIIKPIDFSASVSNNVQDVLVTFVAMRADGNEVIVDNKFLKIHNPLLLIDFYENHLKYSTP